MELYFYTRDGCHLCDRLESLISNHVKAFARSGAVDLIKRNLEENDAWYEKYWDRIPVVEFEGTVILEGRPEEAAVAKAMNSVISAKR